MDDRPTKQEKIASIAHSLRQLREVDVDRVTNFVAALITKDKGNREMRREGMRDRLQSLGFNFLEGDR